MEKEELQAMITNLWGFRTVMAAIKLNVFEILNNFNDTGGIAKEIGTSEDAVERLLNALVAIGLVSKTGDEYFNSQTASEFLLKESKNYYGDFMLMSEDSDRSWIELDKTILSGPIHEGNRERLSREIFTRAMHNNAQSPARALSEKISLDGRKHILDIGGGSGAFSIILTNKYDGLRATIIEQSAVSDTLNGYISREGDSSRISTIFGDYFKIGFPSHDVALFGQIFHSNSPEQNLLLLRKVHGSIEESGMVIITEFLMDDERTSPLFPVLFDINMLKQARNARAYSFSDIRKLLEKAGFSGIEKKHLTGPHTAIIAYKQYSS